MKAPGAFRGISEVAEALGVRQHTLRAWETRFPFVKPVKRPDGRRYYRPADIAMLRELHRLIAEEKRSVEEILRIHREGGLKPATEASAAAIASETPLDAAGRLRAVLGDLVQAKARLSAVLGLGEGPPPVAAD